MYDLYHWRNGRKIIFLFDSLVFLVPKEFFSDLCVLVELFSKPALHFLLCEPFQQITREPNFVNFMRMIVIYVEYTILYNKLWLFMHLKLNIFGVLKKWARNYEKILAS